MRIAIDITGGDNCPKDALDASLRFAKDYQDIELTILGFSEDKPTTLPNNVVYREVSECIDICDDPAMSIRTKKDSAIVVGAELVKENAVDAFLSSGSTGAIVSAGVLKVKRLKNVARPAFPIFLPNEHTGKMRMYLDVGATVDAKPEHIVSNAKLAKVYTNVMFGITNPNIKLLNIGAEETKGDEVYKQAYQLLKEESDLNFTGNVEGYNLLDSEADIIVMEGFVGNIVLKTLEGTFDMFKTKLKKMMLKNLKGKISALLLNKSLKEFKEELNPHKIACAPVLGIDGLIVKVHGSAKEENYYNALVETKNLVDNQLIEKMRSYEL